MAIFFTRQTLKERLLQVFDKQVAFKIDRPQDSLNGDYAIHLGQLRQLNLPVLQDKLQDNLAGIFEITQHNNYWIFHMTESSLKMQIEAANEQGAAFGATGQMAEKRVNVEFVSADPIGPLSIGRGRIAIIGDALCRLLTWQGARVTREYFINDDESSSRLTLLGESIFAAYSAYFDRGKKISEGVLDSAFIREVAREIAHRDGDRHLETPRQDIVRIFAQEACERAIASHRATLEKLHTQIDLWVYETALIKEGRVEAALKELHEHKATYEKDGALWIASTRWGDNADRPLVRANKKPTYLATDTAYHLYRFERGFDTVISIWTDEHRQYVERTHAVLTAAGHDADRLKVLLTAPVQWEKDKSPVPSNEAPNTVDTALLKFDETTLRLAFLLAANNKTAVLDFALLSRDDEKNPVYELQLLPARLAQLQREASAQEIPESQWSSLQHDLARWVAQWPDEIETATTQLAPHRIAAYLRNGAEITRNILAQHRSGQALDAALLSAAHQVARNGFTVLGVNVKDRL